MLGKWPRGPFRVCRIKHSSVMREVSLSLLVSPLPSPHPGCRGGDRSFQGQVRVLAGFGRTRRAKGWRVWNLVLDWAVRKLLSPPSPLSRPLQFLWLQKNEKKAPRPLKQWQGERTGPGAGRGDEVGASAPRAEVCVCVRGGRRHPPTRSRPHPPPPAPTPLLKDPHHGASSGSSGLWRQAKGRGLQGAGPPLIGRRGRPGVLREAR